MDLEAEYPHLDPPAREVILLTPAERLAWFQNQQTWIPYPVAQSVLALVDEAIHRPRGPRMKGYLVIAESNNGKSRLSRECVVRYPMRDDPEAESIVLQTLRIELPPNPDEGSLYDLILDQLCQPYRPKDPLNIKRRQVINALRRCGLRALLVDELQRVLSSNQIKRRQVIEALRNIAGEVPVPLVVFTTARGANALASSDEMINRLHPVELPIWQVDNDWRILLSSFVGVLPLRERSPLTSRKATTAVHAMTEGLIGEVRDLLDMALQQAFTSGKEIIDVDLLSELPWTRPSDRKRLIRKYGKATA